MTSGRAGRPQTGQAGFDPDQGRIGTARPKTGYRGSTAVGPRGGEYQVLGTSSRKGQNSSESLISTEKLSTKAGHE